MRKLGYFPLVLGYARARSDLARKILTCYHLYYSHPNLFSNSKSIHSNSEKVPGAGEFFWKRREI